MALNCCCFEGVLGQDAKWVAGTAGKDFLSLLGSVIAIRCIQLYLTNNKLLYIILGVLGFLMGSFSKESTEHTICSIIAPVQKMILTCCFPRSRIVCATFTTHSSDRNGGSAMIRSNFPGIKK